MGHNPKLNGWHRNVKATDDVHSLAKETAECLGNILYDRAGKVFSPIAILFIPSVFGVLVLDKKSVWKKVIPT